MPAPAGSEADDEMSGYSIGYHNEDVPLPLIISKIESTEALDELPAIIEASDGIMVARTRRLDRLPRVAQPRVAQPPPFDSP